jgi:glucose/arabinose dehydrogenase
VATNEIMQQLSPSSPEKQATPPCAGRRTFSERAYPAGLVLFLVLILLALTPPPSLRAATLPGGFAESLVANNLLNPTAMEFAPDGRLFVCQQGGQLRVIKNGQLLAAPFLTVPVDQSGERGLLGVAFDPDFVNNGFVYVYYTAVTPAVHNRVSRFTANGDVAVNGSEVPILDLENLSAAQNHNGGAIHFGEDGFLYVAVGDNANGNNSQLLTNRLGKVLRIGADGSIPTTNPFFNTATGLNRAIWALGLRNPFTFSVERQSGRLFINDVGQATFEEINEGVAGANYGWPLTEGPTTDPRFRGPIFAYGRGTGTNGGCAITGGAFYNPPALRFPVQYHRDYFFADLCNGWIRNYDPVDGSVSVFATGIPQPVDLKVGADGALYYLARGAGAVYRIEYTLNQVPQITQHPASVTVAVGQPAAFSVSAAGTPPLGYQWQRNGVNIPGATQPSYNIPSTALADNGARFRCVVSNHLDIAISNEAVLTVINNAQPTGTITAPAPGTLYRAGDTISYAGTGSDPENGALPATAFTWQVDFHHDDHVHPFLPATTGSVTGAFTIPTTGETAANVWYRVILTVRDSGGLTHTSFVDVRPRTTAIPLASSPSGLQVTLDDQPHTAPYWEPGVVGMTRTLGVVSPQMVNGIPYVFDSWSDGGAARHAITTPDNSPTYTAVFRRNGGSTGTGSGLLATYHDHMDFTGLSVVRTDPTVNFFWGSGSPAAPIGPDTFSARWSGRIQAQFSETYTFYTQSDDGVRLWVNGRLLINNWTNHSETENSGSIALTAGQQVPITLEYYENGGGAVAKLLWSSPSTVKSVVPRSQLYSVASNRLLTLTAPNGGAQAVGTTHPITWTSSNVTGNVKLEYSTDDGASWMPIHYNTENDGFALWTVQGPPVSRAFIRISSLDDPSCFDVTEVPFAINTQPALFLNYPNGAEVQTAGLDFPIRWNFLSVSGNVRIEYSLNGGRDWLPIYRSTQNDGFAWWTVQGPPTNRARIRITALSDTSVSDVSDGDFTIRR